MGKKSAPTPPPPPDPLEIAKADAQVNRINQFTPFGDLVFGGEFKDTATLSFSPEIQRLFEQQQGIDQSLLTQGQNLLNQFDPRPIDASQFQLSPGGAFTPLTGAGQGIQGGIGTFGLPALPNLQGSFGGFGNVQTGLPNTPDIQTLLQGLEGLPEIPQNIEQFRGDVESAVFNRSRRLLDPIFSQQEEALRDRLSNQGLPTGSQAFLTDFRNFSDARNRTFADLADQAVIRGGQEASRSLGDILAARGQGFGESLASGQFNNQATAQAFAQALGSGQFANQAQQQQFAQSLGQAAFGNDAAQQMFANALANNQFGLSQNLAAGQFANAAQQQGFGQLSGQTAANNALQQQLLSNFNNAQLGNFNLEQQVNADQFNQLASLLGLQQVQAPGLNSFFGPGQVDVLGANALSSQVAQNNFNAQLQQQQGLLGGLFGLGGALLTGAGAAGGFGGLFGGFGGGGGGGSK